MQIEAFLLCDAATDSMGKLNILGSFDYVTAPSVPAMHPACTVALRVRFQSNESGKYRIKINFVDEDGTRTIQSFNSILDAQFRKGISSKVFNLIINIQQLKLMKFGEYSIDLIIDDNHITSLPLLLKQI